MPKRIQLSRRKGWRKPENTVVVARPTKWGNPFTVNSEHLILVDAGFTYVRIDDRASAVDYYYGWLFNELDAQEPGDPERPQREAVRVELAGKNLACWCPLDQPCHADVLLALANAEVE